MSTPSTSNDGNQKPATDSVAVIDTCAAAMVVVVSSCFDEQVLPSTALSQPNHLEEATIDCTRTTNVSNGNTNDDDTIPAEIQDSSAYRCDARTGNDNHHDDRNNDANTVTTCANHNQQCNNGLDLRQGRVSKASVVGVSCTNDSVDKQVNLSMEDEDVLDILANSHAYITQQVIHDMKRTVDESTTRPNSNDNANVGAFYMNGPSQRNEQSDDDEDFSDEEYGNGTVTDLPEQVLVTLAEANNINLTVQDNYYIASSTHMAEATLVDDSVVVTAIPAPGSTTADPTTKGSRFVRSLFTRIVLVLSVLSIIVVVGIIVGVRSKSSTPPQVYAVPPMLESDNRCFQDGIELKGAAIDYLAGNDVVKRKYGEIGSWCVHKVKDFSGLFNGNDIDDTGVATGFDLNISQWNTSSATTMVGMFANATNFNADISGWDVSSVTDMTELFSYAESFNADLSMWDVSRVTKMNSMFENTISFNSSISQWNTSSVKSMSGMFYNAILFNGDLLGWDVSSVTDVREMFSGALNFNGDLSTWNTSSVKDMGNMFYNTTLFNQDISYWDVSNVHYMDSMFYGATSFSGNLSMWDVSNVVDMSYMFSDALSFNGNLSTWDVSNVNRMGSMFARAESFNGNLSLWDVSQVAYMYSMFEGATSFNGDLSTWDVSNVVDMFCMFKGATSFNGNLSTWNVMNVSNMVGMFLGATSFNGNLSAWDVSNVYYMSSMFADTTSFNGDLSMWNVSNAFNLGSMFENATGFNQSLCSWGDQLSYSSNMKMMFLNAESCPNESDPDILNVRPGPFCHGCS